MGTPESRAFGVPQPEPDGEVETVGVSGSSADFKDDAIPLENDLSSESPESESDGADSKPSADESTSRPAPEDPPLDDVTAALRTLEAQVRGFHARAENYEQIIRQMQTRIEQLQGDQVQALLKPVIQRFAGLHAQATEAWEEARDRGEPAERDFSFFAASIEEALGLMDIESVEAAPSVKFDSGKHHASRIVATDDPDLDHRVQRVLRQGFTYAGASRVFLPAQVSVYRYERPKVAEADETPENNPTGEPGEGDPGE